MDAIGLYLDLMKRILANTIYQDPASPLSPVKAGPEPPGQAGTFEEERRVKGEDWPLTAHTMVGLKRLDNVQACMERVLADGIRGDVIETGVWRGGVCIFMRAVLLAHGVRDRVVWVADSFEGLPVAGRGSGGLDYEMRLHRLNEVLGVPMHEVQENFRRYNLLDEQVKFLPGWFCDTLPAAPIRELAVLRLDGDLYASTMDALDSLYPRLAVGGFVIVDDYGLSICRQAIHAYREKHDIKDEILSIDNFGAYWRRTS